MAGAQPARETAGERCGSGDVKENKHGKGLFLQVIDYQQAACKLWGLSSVFTRGNGLTEA